MRTLSRAEQFDRAGYPRPENCEICGTRTRRALCYDHDHTHGTFRGWICHNCNVALGLMDDSVERLQLLIDYLEWHRRHREALNSLFTFKRSPGMFTVMEFTATKEQLLAYREAFNNGRFPARVVSRVCLRHTHGDTSLPAGHITLTHEVTQ